jgi:shikimate O-hydroxycinnamoyltransferase
MEWSIRAGATGAERIPLSVYDLLTGQVYTPRAFFYRERLDGAALRASLARTLRHFPILAGRLRSEGGLGVTCSDAGVRFVEVERAEPMPDYGPDRPAKRDLKRLVRAVNPLWVINRDTPLVTVQLTHMADGGSVLGVCINHSLVDGTSYMAFLESWSREHRGLPYPEPSHDRPRLDAAGERAEPGARDGVRHFVVTRRLARLRFYARLVVAGLRLRTVVFRLSPVEVQRIKEAAAAGLHGDGRWISTNDAVTAHLWKAVAELRGRDEASRESLGLIAGVHRRLAGDLPVHYFGNCASHTTPRMSAGELRSLPLGRVAAAVRDALDENSPEKLRAEIAFLVAQRAAGRSSRVLPQMMLDVFGESVTLNNWSKLPFYGLDFGAGRPFWYDVPAAPIPWLTLIAPTPAEGGRDVHLALPVDKLPRFNGSDWQSRLHRYA